MNETIYYGAIISALTILVNLFISIHTINTNRKLNDENTKINAENAGKNRVIHEIDQIDTSKRDPAFKDLNDKLNSGDYTILSAFVNHGNTSQTRYVLGKIKP